MLAICGVLCAPSSHAQSSNGTYTLVQETLSSAGGALGGGNPLSAQTALGLPAGGMSANGTVILIGGLGAYRQPPAEPVSAALTVTGTVDDPGASVEVNGLPAAVSGTTFTAAGVRLALGRNVLTATAADALGNTASRAIAVSLDLAAAQKTPRFSIQVLGTVAEASASVFVNGVPASVAGGAFSASVPLTNGLNTLTATAVDLAGNTSAASIRVLVPPPTTFPPRPTVGTFGPPLPSVTTEAVVTIGGTKTAGTSMWVNGQLSYPADGGTTWTATVNLLEGDNDLVLVAKDAGGASSTPVSVTIVLDTLPPVMTVQASATTNLSPLLITGTVDDSLTTVTVNGLPAARTRRAFEASVPLTLGTNLLTVEAISPHGYRTTQTLQVILGTVPTIQGFSPPDASFVYAHSPLAIQAVAADAEGDPIEYQVLLDHAVLAAWGPNRAASWTPSTAEGGLHTVAVSVRDGYGGVGSRQAEAFVVRKPVEHP